MVHRSLSFFIISFALLTTSFSVHGAYESKTEETELYNKFGNLIGEHRVEIDETGRELHRIREWDSGYKLRGMFVRDASKITGKLRLDLSKISRLETILEYINSRPSKTIEFIPSGIENPNPVDDNSVDQEYLDLKKAMNPTKTINGKEVCVDINLTRPSLRLSIDRDRKKHLTALVTEYRRRQDLPKSKRYQSLMKGVGVNRAYQNEGQAQRQFNEERLSYRSYRSRWLMSHETHVKTEQSLHEYYQYKNWRLHLASLAESTVQREVDLTLQASSSARQFIRRNK